MNTVGQFRAVLKLQLRTARTRIRAAAIIILSVSAVVCVLLSMLSLGEGIRLDYLIVKTRGAMPGAATAPIAEGLVNDVLRTPGVRRARGLAVVDSEVAVVGPLPKRDGEMGYTGFLGVGELAPDVIPGFRLLAGRLPDLNGSEILVGRTARRKFAGLDIGDSISLYGKPWKVAGIFATGSFMEGNLIFAGPRLATALKEHGPPQQIPFYSLIVGLTSPDSFPGFREAIGKRWPAYDVDRLSDFWRQRWESLPRVMVLFDLVVSGLLSLGAVTGMLHVIQASFDQRQQEIAVLRAMGYEGEVVAAAFVTEIILLALVGAAIGTGVDWLWLDGRAYNGAYGVFSVSVDQWMYLIGASWALMIALTGAVMPAWRSIMVPIAEALSA